jgi:ribonuclease BN (tRNA processing enzyme)
MKVRLVGSMIAPGPLHQQFAASVLIDETVAIDAGSIGLMPSVAAQRRIRHVFLTHSHQDHIASLPMFLDNAYDGSPGGVTVHGHAETLAALRRHVFNDCVWPDLLRLSPVQPPFLTLQPISAGDTVRAGGLQLTAVPLDHAVPTLGYVVEDGRSVAAVISDTAFSPDLWNTLAGWPRRLNALLVECSFPNRLQALADQTRHLTPQLVREVCRKLAECPAVIAVHVKPAYCEEIVEELRRLELSQLIVGEADAEYEF